MFDLETDVVDEAFGPEVRAQALFSDRYVGGMHGDHPLRSLVMTVGLYTQWDRVVAWRNGMKLGVIHDALLARSLKLEVVESVDGFSAAFVLACGIDPSAIVPEHHTAARSH